MPAVTSTRYAVVTSTLALMIALGGTSYAAVKIGTKQLKNNAVTSAKVKNGSLLSDDFKAGQTPAGPVGPVGPAGPLLATLPAGKSLTGSFAVGGKAPAANDKAFTEISFAFPLSTPAAISVVPDGGASTTACPGNVAAPRSTPGWLCIYEGFREGNPGPVGAFSNVTGEVDLSSLHGATLWVASTAANTYDVSGTWSVTAS